MGTWYKAPRPKVDTHKCENPEFATREQDIRPGDRYQCSCGKVYEVTEVADQFAYDDPKGGWAIRWKRVNNYATYGQTPTPSPIDRNEPNDLKCK